jgi:hypothetical protein
MFTNRPLPGPTLRQLNAVFTFLTSTVILMSQLHSGPADSLFPSVFWNKILYSFLTAKHTTSSTHLVSVNQLP